MATSGTDPSDLDELVVDIGILIVEEHDVTHRLGGHREPVEGCLRCARVAGGRSGVDVDQARSR